MPNSSAAALEAARADTASSPAPGDNAPCPYASWIEIELVDDLGKPVPNVEYKVVDPTGREHAGLLDKNGHARVEGVAAGNCTVSFPLYDRREWIAVS